VPFLPASSAACLADTGGPAVPVSVWDSSVWI